ncbi:MAG TPA: hypothetical protein VFT23_01385 [Burkholderiales bacterium]|nr:hypothetical protein [Burkholderiales bacterium]
MRRDLEVNESFRAVLARLSGFMVEDPRPISPYEEHRRTRRVRTMGKDVRHASAQEIEQALRG